ncbi:MAG: ABC transporter substrate-binding protein [Deltaproteobacteria bacterium]|nr:ABC transporter substrate-binding protein [Deltaproteobacteria bacterium]
MSYHKPKLIAGFIISLWSFFLCLVPVRALAGAQTEIRFVNWKSQFPKVWVEALAAFETQNPGLKIVQEIGPHSSTEFHDLVTQKLKNRDPAMDVFFMDVIWPAEFAAAGWALPLDRFFAATEREKFLAAPVLANTYRGQIYGVPVFTDAGMLYYRKDLLARYGFSPPRTWPELVAQAKTIVAQEQDPHLTGFSGQFKQYEGLICNMMEYILSNGGSLWDEDALQGTLHHPKVIEAVRFVRDRVIGEISHRGVLAYQEPESLASFSQGRAVFHRNWPYAWEIANDPKRSRVAGKVGITVLPAFPGGKSVSTLGGWQLGISRFSRKPDPAWKFVSFMSSLQMQKRIALFAGRAPARRALYRDPDVLKKRPEFESELDVFVNAVPRPRTPVYIPLSNIMQRFFSSAIAVRDSNIESLARLASRDMNRVLDLLRERTRP